ncbi:hypothetical protein [Paraburkholderia antibiotica]|uniref:Uncharacterized protein n=1 Tax=Paraburkholderia antibiotica TaxID=2728839 RepID=A0A7X9X2C4_9BURK|nr:hypothetical protein [Paraburkholderia antibiotica]NML30146.1 hypothetical protein [Paraburkholderia antibiotica]
MTTIFIRAVVTAVAVALAALIAWGCISLRSRTYVIAAALTCFTLVMAACGFSFQSRTLNVGMIFGAVAGYAYLSFASFALRPKALGIATGAALTAPLILAVFSLPVTGLGIMFILDDMAAPYRTEQVRDGIVCRTKEIGNAASGDGVQVELIRPVLRFARRTLYTHAVLYTDTTSRDPCADAYASLKSARR